MVILDCCLEDFMVCSDWFLDWPSLTLGGTEKKLSLYNLCSIERFPYTKVSIKKDKN